MHNALFPKIRIRKERKKEHLFLFFPLPMKKTRRNYIMEEVIQLQACEVNYYIEKDGLVKSQIFTVGEKGIVRLTYICRPYGIHFIEAEYDNGQVFRFYDIHSTTFFNNK
jgi:hypothetical protein